MKYIVIRVRKANDNVMEIPIIFPDAIVHSDMADIAKRLVSRQFGGHAEPVSAGFVSSMELMTTLQPKIGLCNGTSSSLGLKSRHKEDDALIRMMDYGSMHVS